MLIRSVAFAFTLSQVLAVSASPTQEIKIAGGQYYVGEVFGEHDYRSHTNTQLAPFFVMKTEVTYSFYQSLIPWAAEHGYALNEGCNGALFEDCQSPDKDRGYHPVANVSWWDAVLFANAYSEQQHLQAYYLSSDGLPLRTIPTNGVIRRSGGNGYRLPAYIEWEVAARGAEKGLENHTYGAPASGSYSADKVANYPGENAVIFATVPVASRQPNAAGLYDMSGNVAEWIDEPYTVENGPEMYLFCGGSYLTRSRTLAACDVHTPGFITPDTGFRLIRSAHD